MARRTEYTKEMILEAAINLFKKEGTSAITAKKIANELHSSVAPIYSVYLSLDDLKKDLYQKIEEHLLEENCGCGICEQKLYSTDTNFDSLISRMANKLEINENSDIELQKKLKEIKENLRKGENRSSIFSQFSELATLVLHANKRKFSKIQILELIAKHKKYIIEFRRK